MALLDDVKEVVIEQLDCDPAEKKKKIQNLLKI